MREFFREHSVKEIAYRDYKDFMPTSEEIHERILESDAWKETKKGVRDHLGRICMFVRPMVQFVVLVFFRFCMRKKCALTQGHVFAFDTYIKSQISTKIIQR